MHIDDELSDPALDDYFTSMFSIEGKENQEKTTKKSNETINNVIDSTEINKINKNLSNNHLDLKEDLVKQEKSIHNFDIDHEPITQLYAEAKIKDDFKPLATPTILQEKKILPVFQIQDQIQNQEIEIQEQKAEDEIKLESKKLITEISQIEQDKAKKEQEERELALEFEKQVALEKQQEKEKLALEFEKQVAIEKQQEKEKQEKELEKNKQTRVSRIQALKIRQEKLKQQRIAREQLKKQQDEKQTQTKLKIENKETPITIQAKKTTKIVTSLQDIDFEDDNNATNDSNWQNIEMESIFPVLFFSMSDVMFGVPLVHLGGIHEISDISPLFGKPPWFSGIMMEKGRKLSAVDTAKWVLPTTDVDIDYKFLVTLDRTPWGLQCEKLHKTENIKLKDVKWRSAPGDRPWLAGMIKEKMCALIHVPEMIKLFEQGMNIKGK